MILNKILSAIKEARNVAILPHISVDGDGYGSSLALAIALKKLNKDATVYLEEDIPSVYSFLPGKDMVKMYDGVQVKHDIVVALDSGDMERLGARVDIFKDAKTTVNIDHHPTNTEFAALNYVDTVSSAVGEIVYQMIKSLGLSINADMASCLYVAITTDTGGFRYSNTTAITHQIAGDLINSGINIAEISQKVFDSVPLRKVKLMGAAINAMELFEDGKTAFIILTDEIMKGTGAKEEDCDGIVNIARSIETVEVAVMMRQRDNGDIKINLRSKSYVDVSAIASARGGGGHKRAAGCTVKGDIQEVKQHLLKDIKGVL